MTDRPYSAGNRKDIRAAEKAQQMLATINREVIAGIMSVKNGRQWVFEMLADAGAFADPFSPDPYVHAYNSGRKAMATRLFDSVMLYAPEQFNTMLRESHERQLVLDRVRNNPDRYEPTEPGSDDDIGAGSYVNDHEPA